MARVKPNQEIKVLAYDIATSFDMDQLRRRASEWGNLRETEPVIIELAKNKYMVVFDYGSVVFFNTDSSEAQSLMERLKEFAQRANRQVYTDDFTLYVGGGPGVASSDQLTVSKFFLDAVKLVAIVLSRSVALSYYEDLIDRSLAKLEKTVDTVAREGRFVGKRRSLIKQVGLANAIQHELAYNLALLDDPDVVWERGEEMQKLYQNLSVQFSIQRRAQIINRKLSIISNSTSFIIEQLQYRTANVLELAIIFLFIVDLIIFLIEISSR